jgi:hypothetical protein
LQKLQRKTGKTGKMTGKIATKNKKLAKSGKTYYDRNHSQQDRSNLYGQY